MSSVQRKAKSCPPKNGRPLHYLQTTTTEIFSRRAATGAARVFPLWDGIAFLGASLKRNRIPDRIPKSWRHFIWNNPCGMSQLLE
jgi:hypothetical protein